MQPEQSSMTILTTVKHGQEKELKALLQKIGRDIQGNTYIRFAEFPTIHFARWVLIPPPDENDPAEPYPNSTGSPYLLAFGTDHDGPDDVLLGDLADRARFALDAIYAHCEGWPGSVADRRRVVEYLQQRRIPYGARHIACRRHTVSELKAAVAARDRMDGYIDNNLRPTRAGQNATLSVADADRQMEAIRSRVVPPGPTVAPPPTNWQVPAAAAAAVGVAGAGLYLLFKRSSLAGWIGAATLAAIPAAYLASLRKHEIAEASKWEATSPPSLEHLAELRRWEDHQVQNQMTHVVTVKPGLFRRLTLHGVLGAIDFAARFYWNRGELGGIPTIHFARWMLFDKDRRLLFFSNYDGSWENYLSDFIDRASAGLTGVWSNTIEFPPAHLLVGDGSRRAEAFKNWTRKYQVETQVWYSAYPQYSVQNLQDALALCQKPTSDSANTLLQKL